MTIWAPLNDIPDIENVEVRRTLRLFVEKDNIDNLDDCRINILNT